jgi:3-oxoacyl-[acyl-carrier-protein] synthase II
MANPVWIMGAGLVTSLADGVSESWSKVVAGQSGVRRIERFDPTGLATQVAASVEWDARLTCAALTRRMADRVVDECMTASPLPAEIRRKAAIFVACAATENDWRRVIAHEAGHREDPQLVYYDDELVSALGERVADRFGSGELPVHLNTACASGSTAIAAAVETLRDGAHDVALVVGSDASVYEESIARFCLLSAMTTRNDHPTGACRPFSADRDGFVMGEGAGALLLVSDDLVRRLGLEPIARVSGVGSATDNFHRTRSTPDGQAIVGSMAAALVDAGLKPTAVRHVNAHGTGTPENDKMESLGINLLFGPHAPEVSVTSNKSMVGHTLTAAGVVEGILAVETLRNRVIPPTINFDTPDPDLGVSVVGNHAAPLEGEHVLSNSFGFGGQNVSIVFSRA